MSRGCSPTVITRQGCATRGKRSPAEGPTNTSRRTNSGFGIAKLGRNRTAAAKAQYVDLLEAQIAREIGDRTGETCRVGGCRGRRIGLAAARQIRRINRALVGDQREEAAEAAARSVGRVQTKERHLLVETAGRRKCGAHVELTETTIEIDAAGTNPGSAAAAGFAILGI